MGAQSYRGGLIAFLRANANRLALVAGLLVFAIAFNVFPGGSAPTRDSKVRYVCVATGETFWLARGEHKILPVANPRSGQRTLVPCHTHDDGRLQVNSRCRGLIERLERDAVNQVVDPETLAVLKDPR